MSNTTSCHLIGSDAIKTSLSSFENMIDEVNNIKSLATISTDSLLPKEFYDKTDITTIDPSILDSYVDTINRINNYITQFGKIDEGESTYGDTNSLNGLNLFGNISDGLNQCVGFLQQAIANLTTSDEYTEPVDPEGVVNALGFIQKALTGIITALTTFFSSLISNGLINEDNQPSGGYYYPRQDDTPSEPVEEVEETPDEVEEEEYSEGIEEDELPEEQVEEEGLVEEEETEVMNGSQLDTVDGKKVVNKVLDSEGNVVAVSVIEDGKKSWYQVSNDKVVTPNDQNLGSYNLNKSITIIDKGQAITIDAGNYNIDNAVYNPDGSLKGLRLNCGEYKLVLGFNANGDITDINYIKALSGVFAIDNSNYDIYDTFGNIIGKYNNGQYYIYETMYNEVGEVVGFRLSPDDEYEQWLYVNSNTAASEYSLFESKQTNEKTSVSMFEKNKGLFGLLGVLFVALGATVVMKKRVAKKEQQGSEPVEEDYNSNEWQEQGLATGNYPIYDVKRDEKGNVTDARINPVDNEFEYWVKV